MVAGIVVFVDSQFVLVSPEKANCLVVLLLQNKTGGGGMVGSDIQSNYYMYAIYIHMKSKKPYNHNPRHDDDHSPPGFSKSVTDKVACQTRDTGHGGDQ